MRNLQCSLQQNYISFDALTEKQCPETLLWTTNVLCLESYLCSVSSLQCVFLSTVYSASGKHRHHTLLLRIIIIVHHYHPFRFFTVQPTNFQGVQICFLCNHADALATSNHRLHQSVDAEWSKITAAFQSNQCEKPEGIPHFIY